jgi:hypothetical protein
VSLYLRINYKYNYKKIKEKDNINVILIIINISGRSSLEEINHVKNVAQKYCWYHRVILHAVEGIVTRCIC